MSGADGERGGADIRSTAVFSSSFFPPTTATSLRTDAGPSSSTTNTWMADLSSSQFLPSSPSSQELSLDSSSLTPSDFSRPNDKLDFPIADGLVRGGLPDSVFPDWKHGSPRQGLENPDEMQKKDPLATQIWKLYTRTKSQLPNQERMENLTWRMMAMSLRRKEREARYVLLLHYINHFFALESYLQDASFLCLLSIYHLLSFCSCATQPFCPMLLLLSPLPLLIDLSPLSVLDCNRLKRVG